MEVWSRSRSSIQASHSDGPGKYGGNIWDTIYIYIWLYLHSNTADVDDTEYGASCIPFRGLTLFWYGRSRCNRRIQPEIHESTNWGVNCAWGCTSFVQDMMSYSDGFDLWWFHFSNWPKAFAEKGWWDDWLPPGHDISYGYLMVCDAFSQPQHLHRQQTQQTDGNSTNSTSNECNRVSIFVNFCRYRPVWGTPWSTTTLKRTLLRISRSSSSWSLAP